MLDKDWKNDKTNVVDILTDKKWIHKRKWHGLSKSFGVWREREGGIERVCVWERIREIEGEGEREVCGSGRPNDAIDVDAIF